MARSSENGPHFSFSFTLPFALCHLYKPRAKSNKPNPCSFSSPFSSTPSSSSSSYSLVTCASFCVSRRRTIPHEERDIEAEPKAWELMGRQRAFFFFPYFSVWLEIEMMSLVMLLAVASVPVTRVQAWRPWPRLFNGSTTHPDPVFGSSKRYEGSSEFVHLQYHMGPVLTSNITIHTIWYGSWQPSQKRIIKGFLRSISSGDAPSPSVSEWWRTVQLYTDQTGSNISSNVLLGSEKNDRYSHGKSLTRLSIQSVIKGSITASTRPLPIDARNGLYLVLTSPDVYMQDFCGQVCGFHYFTFPSIVGTTLPYAWVGNSAAQCPAVCAYPFAVPSYIPGLKPLNPPNGDAGVDGMISVIAHEIAELSTNPLVNAWYAGQDPSFPTEIADLCEGIYGTGGGGSYTGQLSVDNTGATYNMNGARRRFLVQWVWNPVLNYCFGPNALDK